MTIVCAECGWTGAAEEVLSAPNPFEQQCTIYACPKCKEIETFHGIGRTKAVGCAMKYVGPTDNRFLVQRERNPHRVLLALQGRAFELSPQEAINVADALRVMAEPERKLTE